MRNRRGSPLSQLVYPCADPARRGPLAAPSIPPTLPIHTLIPPFSSLGWYVDPCPATRGPLCPERGPSRPVACLWTLPSRRSADPVAPSSTWTLPPWNVDPHASRHDAGPSPPPPSSTAATSFPWTSRLRLSPLQYKPCHISCHHGLQGVHPDLQWMGSRHLQPGPHLRALPGLTRPLLSTRRPRPAGFLPTGNVTSLIPSHQLKWPYNAFHVPLT